MRIERLRLVVEEAEAAIWCTRFLEGRAKIEEPHLAFQPDRIVFDGKVRVPVIGLVPFHTEWEASVAGAEGRIDFRLLSANAFGWGGGSGFLCGLIMEQATTGLAGRPGCEVRDDRIRLDPAVWLEQLPVSVGLRISRIRLEAGRAVIEAD